VVKIRTMLADEAQTVLTLWNENCLEAAGRSLGPDESVQVLKLLLQYAAHNHAFCFVAESKTELVGFITACLISHPVLASFSGEIEELYVQPQSRHLGIGAKLVESAVNSMRDLGASTIRTTADVSSHSAKEFWRHLGWSNDLTIFSLDNV